MRPTWPERLLDAGSDLLSVHEADGTIRYANAAARRLLGLDPHAVVGANPFRLLHPDDLPAVVEALLRLRDRPGATHAFLTRARHQDGSWRWLEAMARNELSDPELQGVIVSCRDVTDRVLFQTALAESETRHRELVEAAPFGIAVVDLDLALRFTNPAADVMLTMVGSVPDQPGGPITPHVHPDDLKALQEAVRRAVQDRAAPGAVECRALRDGEPVLVVRATVVPYTWEGSATALLIAEDVTELRSAERRRTESDAQVRLLLDSSAQGLLGTDSEGRVTFVNPAAARMLGLDPVASLGASAHELVHHSHPDGTPYPASECPWLRAAANGDAALGEGEVFWHTDGTPVPVDFQATPIVDDGHSGLVVSFQDVSQRLQVEQQLAQQAAFLRAVLDALPAQKAVVDADGTVTEVNHAWTAFARDHGGVPEASGPGVNFFAVCEATEGADRPFALEAAEGLRAVLDGGVAGFQQDVVCVPPDEPPLYFSLHVVPLQTSQGGAVLGYTDITERKALEVRAAHRAMHDELTGLPNRALLLDHLEHALRMRDGGDLALLFIDLDHFKLVNDGYGHEAGDRVLRELARRLRGAVRPSDTVARLAGDEFVVLCERLPFPTEAYALAERVLAALDAPFAVGDTHVKLGASIGIAAAEDRSLTPAELLRAADQAMFEAKARGRHQFALYDDGVHQRSLERVEQALSVRRLVEQDQVTVHYQPLVDLRDGRMTGVEALLRWRGGQDAPEPAAAVALAEETGMIAELGGRVLRQALHQASTFRRADGSVLALSVNLAPQQLDEVLVPTLAEAAEAVGYPLPALTLELTERTVMANLSASVAVLGRLRDLGVRIAIDDFGAGYSSLAYLQDLPLDTLKIDRDFVRRLGERPDDVRIIRAIIELGRALELEVVAEGVESDEQRTRLVDLGCVQGQGFLFGAAQPADRIRQLTA